MLDILNKLEDEKLIFSTSLGYEDQIISHYIATNQIKCKIFTLDTGRLFPETYSVLQKTREKYNIKIDVFFPITTALEFLLTNKVLLVFMIQ